MVRKWIGKSGKLDRFILSPSGGCPPAGGRGGNCLIIVAVSSSSSAASFQSVSRTISHLETPDSYRDSIVESLGVTILSVRDVTLSVVEVAVENDSLNYHVI